MTACLLTGQAEAGLVEVARGVAGAGGGVLGRGGGGGGGGARGPTGDGHLAHGAVVQTPGDAPHLRQLGVPGGWEETSALY